MQQWVLDRAERCEVSVDQLRRAREVFQADARDLALVARFDERTEATPLEVTLACADAPGQWFGVLRSFRGSSAASPGCAALIEPVSLTCSTCKANQRAEEVI